MAGSAETTAPSQPSPPDLHAVASAFDVGPARTLTFITSTLAAHIWRLETDRGRWVVKQHTWHCDPDRDRTVFDLENVAADAGVPLPRPVSTIEGAPIAELADASGSVLTVRVWPWLDLDVIARPTERRTLNELGAALARLHALPVAADPRPLHPYYWQAPADDVWESLHTRALAAGAAWAADLSEQTGELRALAAFAREHPPGRRSAWCHFDLTEANFRLDSQARLVIIDWDDAQVGDPDRELGWAVATWCDTSSVRDLVDSYLEHGGPGRLDDIGALSMAACIHCQWMAAAADLALDGESEGDRTKAAWLERMLDRQLNMTRLRSYLEASRSG